MRAPANAPQRSTGLWRRPRGWRQRPTWARVRGLATDDVMAVRLALDAAGAARDPLQRRRRV